MRVKKSDRNLFALAAKAAHFEIKTGFDHPYYPKDCVLVFNVGRWNPRDDDSDSFRLAVFLGLTIVHRIDKAGSAETAVYTGKRDFTKDVCLIESTAQMPTRRRDWLFSGSLSKLERRCRE